MNTFVTMLHNYVTTVLGFVAGVGYYLAQNGLVMPTTKDEAKSFVAGLMMLLFGLASKDATTGSKPS